MKTTLAIVLVLSILGLNQVSAQSSNTNILGPLLVGGLAGWGINHLLQRNRRQDAINDALLAQNFGLPDPRFGVGFGGGSGFGGGFGRPVIGYPRRIAYGK